MWTIAIEVGLKIIGWLFNRSAISKEQKEAFLEFYESYERLGNSSAAQRDDVNGQIKDFMEKEGSQGTTASDGVIKSD